MYPLSSQAKRAEQSRRCSEKFFRKRHLPGNPIPSTPQATPRTHRRRQPATTTERKKVPTVHEHSARAAHRGTRQAPGRHRDQAQKTAPISPVCLTCPGEGRGTQEGDKGCQALVSVKPQHQTASPSTADATEKDSVSPGSNSTGRTPGHRTVARKLQQG